jgi:alkanesulfonate monooxygenase SsuD/methylene tetrahydromethanopterin reductase-like flavin-dependent oxidoreductase (luciferase family)
MIKETTLTGTPEEIRARIRKMEAMGVKQVAVAGGESEITEFATHVIQELR